MTEEANAAYRESPEGKVEVIAGGAGMDTAAAEAMLAGFGFPPAAEQTGAPVDGRRRAGGDQGRGPT